MFTPRVPALTLLVMLLALGACGDDEDDAGDSAQAQEEAPATSGERTTPTDTEASAADPASNPRAKELTSCLEARKLTVFVNAGSQADAAYQLVIDAGSAGVLYGYADAASARSAQSKVDESEGSAGRKAEVIGDTVFAFFPAGHSLAQPAKYKLVRTCAAGR